MAAVHGDPAAARRHGRLFLTGAVLIAVAARLSYANIEPSRAKAARRREVLEAFIARKRGAGGAGSTPDQIPPKAS